VELLTTGSHSWPVVAVSASNDREMIRNAMLAGARDYVVLPAADDELRKSVLRVYQHEHERRSVPGDRGYSAYGSVITVFGVKGGIGKTATAVNLAAAITSGTKHHVALVDADLQFGDCAVMLDLVPERTICDAVSEVDPAKPHLIDPYLTEHSSRLSLLAAPTDPRDANQVTADDVGNVLKSLAATRDYVVVDTSPQIDAVTALAIDLSAIVLLLVVPEVPTVRRAKAALTLLEEAGYTRDKLKLVINRASRRSEVANADLAAALGYPIYMEIPDDRAIPQSITTGVPLVIANPKSDAGRAYLDLGLKLTGATDGQRRRGFLGLFGRGGNEPDTDVAPPPNPIASDDALLGAWAPVLGGATVERWAADREEPPAAVEHPAPGGRNIFLVPTGDETPEAPDGPGELDRGREREPVRPATSNSVVDDVPAAPASETRHG
jgi:pilus assembly protein CpaE